MSPLPSAATTVTHSPTVASVPSTTVPAEQSTSAMPYQLGTGSIVLCAVAIISVASYFYHKRGGAADSALANSARIPFSSFLSPRHHRNSDVAPVAATANRIAESNPEQHVSMVYARFFHPTFWNLVECHPPTSSTPAILVEDEASEIPVPEPKPYGMTSFLDVDDEDEDNSSKRTCEKWSQGTSHLAVQLPPYDASSPTNVNFRSEVIGMTIRPGAFLSVPCEFEDNSSEDVSDSESDGLYSTDEDPLTAPLGLPPRIRAHDPRIDYTLSACDVVSATSLTPSHNRRYGLADMTNLAQHLQHTIPEEPDVLASTISLINASEPAGTERSLDRPELLDAESTHAHCNLSLHAPHKGLATGLDPSTSEQSLDRPESLSGASTYAHCSLDIHAPRDDGSEHDGNNVPYDGVVLIRRILKVLRDPELDCQPGRALDDIDDKDENVDADKGTGPHRTATQVLASVFTQSASSGSDKDKGPSLPPPLPSPGDTSTTSTTTKPSYVYHVRKWLAPVWFNAHITVQVPQGKGHARTRRDRTSRVAPWVA